jgi:hypothetical protein
MIGLDCTGKREKIFPHMNYRIAKDQGFPLMRIPVMPIIQTGHGDQ